MTSNKAAFYFANLGADILRCVAAAETSQIAEYALSLERARNTLSRIEKENRPEAYEEGLLLLRGLEYARAAGTLAAFRDHLNQIITPLASRLGFA